MIAASSEDDFVIFEYGRGREGDGEIQIVPYTPCPLCQFAEREVSS